MVRGLDRRVALGLGIGLVVASLLMLATAEGKVSREEIERRARELGMVYREEVVVVDTQPEEAKEAVKTEVEYLVVVPVGFSARRIAEVLELGGVIPSGEELAGAASAAGLDKVFRAGIYRFRQGEKVEDVLRRLVEGDRLGVFP